MLSRTQGILIGAALALLLLSGGIGAWIIYGPNTPDYPGERSVKIPEGARFAAVADSLEASGILAARTPFVWMGRLTGWGDQVKAGHYTFAAGASNYDLLDALRRGLQTPIRLTIPPGSRPNVVAAVAARHMAFPADSFAAALRDTALATALDTDTTHLFGYMLPETYFFYWQTPARTVVRRVKEAFDTYYAERLQAAADSLDLSKAEVANLAAIVEWETARRSEKPTIAGVYLNRLDRGMALQADPTVQYAVLAREGRKRRLFFRDYEIDHPYNTYTYRGLPPGPVTNPSKSSLQAAVQPEQHNYYYFVADGDGGHTFSRTHREHINAANAYRELMRERRREQASSNGSSSNGSSDSR